MTEQTNNHRRETGEAREPPHTRICHRGVTRGITDRGDFPDLRPRWHPDALLWPRGGHLVGWPSRRGWKFNKQPGSAFPLTWPLHPAQPGVVDGYVAKKAKGEDGRAAPATASPATEEPQRGHIPDLASERLRGSLQHHHDGKYCPPRLRLPLLSQAPWALPLFVYLPGTTLCRGPPWFTKIVTSLQRTETAVIFTLLLPRLGVWQESGGMCVYLRGGEAGLVLFALGLLS